MAGSRHRELFFAYNGPGPYGCHFECDRGPVTFAAVHVHHVDGDHDNNDPANLVPAHGPCHRGHHRRLDRGKPKSAKTRAAMSAAKTRHYSNPAARAKHSKVMLQQPRYRCGECDVVSTGGGLGNHHKGTGHTGKLLVE